MYNKHPMSKNTVTQNTGRTQTLTLVREGNVSTQRESAMIYPSNAFATRVALCPPKPNELFTATRTFFSRATCGV